MDKEQEHEQVQEQGQEKKATIMLKILFLNALTFYVVRNFVYIIISKNNQKELFKKKSVYIYI